MASPSWQKNLYAIFVAQFLVVGGFSAVNPFLPLFIQQLGNLSNQQAALWAGIATGSGGVAMFISAPLWGIVADRWGRKPMVLRSQFGGAIIVALVSLAPNIAYVVGLRFAQGLLAGTVAAASALVAATTPRDKMPFAMGLLMVAVFGGAAFGPLLGGVMADILGYKATFLLTGGLLLAGGLIVLFLVKENFERPVPGKGASLHRLWRLAISKEMLPLLMALAALHMGPRLIEPIIPVFIRELNPGGLAATTSGLAFSLMGVVTAISSLVSGRLGQNVSLRKMLVISCLGTSLMYLPAIWAGTVTQLLIFIALTGLLKGGVMTSASALVGLSVTRSEQGIAFGIAQSANSLGNGIGPLIGGGLAPLIGLRGVFAVSSGLFMLIGLGLAKLLPDIEVKRPPNQEVTGNT